MIPHIYRVLLFSCTLIFLCNTTQAALHVNTAFAKHPKPPLGLSINTDSLSVSGQVKDSKGNVMEGVVISEKGTTNTVVSDAQGAFKIAASPNGILVLLKSGFIRSELHVNNQRHIDVGLPIEEQETPADSIKTSADTTKSIPTAIAATDTSKLDNGAAASKNAITGLVSGPEGSIAGASVSVEGTNTTVLTDETDDSK